MTKDSQGQVSDGYSLNTTYDEDSEEEEEE